MNSDRTIHKLWQIGILVDEVKFGIRCKYKIIDNWMKLLIRKIFDKINDP